MFDFRFNTPILSLNQGQESVFTIWQCAQSISRIKLPLKMIILEKNVFGERALICVPFKKIFGLGHVSQNAFLICARFFLNGMTLV